ncbi:hypothetical protein B0H67DRAFT_442980, partial [Lasiosphaeris hirsuta]
IRSPAYRFGVLEANNVYFEHPSNQLPDDVLFQTTRLFVPSSPPMPEVLANLINELDRLCTYGGNESEVIQCFSAGPLFHDMLPRELCLRIDRKMKRHLIPSNPTAPYAIPQPRPDLMYGYPLQAFTQKQQNILKNLHPEIPSYSEACPNLFFPFFIVEFKVTAGTRGDLWVAGNQCAGGSAACLQAVDQLNAVIREKRCFGEMPSFCYSLVLDNNLGQVYVSWKDEDYHIQKVASFLLSDPEALTRLFHCVENILEWGK